MNDSFEEKQAFLGNFEAEKAYSTRDRKRYNPSPDVFRIAFDPNNDRMVIYIPGGGFRLQVYSLNTLKHMQEIKIPGQLTPFDEDYGKTRLEDYKSQNASRPWLQEGIFLDPPKYFTPIFLLGGLPTGEIDVALGNPLLPNNKQRIFLGEQLSVKEKSIYRKGEVFVLASTEEHFLIRYPAKEGELVLEKVSSSTYLDPDFKRPK
jgi:hypothetical protein